jgi:hypothetical protein
MTQKLKKLSAYIALLVVPFGVATLGLAGKASRTRQVNPAGASQPTDAAFRDGFYLGKLDASEARKGRPSIGRWSDPKDRASFLAGYQRGYEEARAKQVGVAGR